MQLNIVIVHGIYIWIASILIPPLADATIQNIQPP